MSTACGIEAFVHAAGADEHNPIQSVVGGRIANQATQVRLVQADGTELEPVEASIMGDIYELVFQNDGEFVNALLRADEGAKQLVAWLPRLGVNDTVEGLDLDAASTASVLIMQGAMSIEGLNRQTVGPAVAARALERIATDAETQTTPESTLFGYVESVLDVADPTDTESTLFVAPVLTSSTTVTSALDPAWWAANSGSLSFTQEEFDEALLAASAKTNVIGCLDPDNIRVVIEVDLNDGRLDGRCGVLSGFDRTGGAAWNTPQEGDAMRFVGSVFEDSPIQDPDLAEQMGGFTPTNSRAMFDDGTNGDAQADDDIWTITFIMPRGIQVAYKFLWSGPGEGWAGHEEWPGNERWLEVVDLNGDGFVRRRESWGDEAANKNIFNLFFGGLNPTSLEWDPPTDLNNDGFPNTREEPFRDEAGGTDCTLDTLETPTGIGPALVECPEN
jgi:hypothetical protein